MRRQILFVVSKHNWKNIKNYMTKRNWDKLGVLLTFLSPFTFPCQSSRIQYPLDSKIYLESNIFTLQGETDDKETN
jgi:hypothetical protein